MAENSQVRAEKAIKIRYRGRIAQIPIYFGKQLRMFVYQSDWKALPMSALIAGLVGMVIRNRMFLTMEGCLVGAFAFTCVCIWNGCFNSVQAICRERDVIKRSHRSGMHISSYLIAIMLYQAMICLLQTIITVYVTKAVGVMYPTEGLFTSWFMLDFAISVFLITYASDMMSLWISTLAKNSTSAMTIMPFILIFQLVFSGGMFSLPEWSRPLTYLTISNPGLKVMASQADYNQRPIVTLWNQIQKLKDSEIGGTVSLGEIMDRIADSDNESVSQIRSIQLGKVLTVEELEELILNTEFYDTIKDETIFEDWSLGYFLRIIRSSEELQEFLDKPIITGIDAINLTFGKAIDLILAEDSLQGILETQLLSETTIGDLVDLIESSGILDNYRDTPLGGTITVGEAADMIAGSPYAGDIRKQNITIKTTVGQVLGILGEENVKAAIEKRIAASSYNPEYDYTIENIISYWLRLIMFAMLFSILATITLEFIDKDKR